MVQQPETGSQKLVVGQAIGAAADHVVGVVELSSEELDRVSSHTARRERRFLCDC
jgi:hypothetical protein